MALFALASDVWPQAAPRGVGPVIGNIDGITQDGDQQYLGKIVNEVDVAIIIGAQRFVQNASITELDSDAKAASLKFPLDTLRFGRWRD